VSTPGFLADLLARLDIFLIWNVVLLVLGSGITDSLPRGKALAGVLIVMALILLAQAGLGMIGSGLGGTVIQRPFF
jgi:hypothetical protein